MRIIAGKWRGRALVAPSGEATRPTADRVREALFSMLTSRLGSFEGLRVADMFAGTGALGMEALSRGAAHVTFVETDPGALEALKANIARSAVEAVTTVVAQPAALVGRAALPFDLVMLDPPYASGLAVAALARLEAQGWLTSASWISVETGAREPLDIPGFTAEPPRKHGKAALQLLRLGAQE